MHAHTHTHKGCTVVHIQKLQPSLCSDAASQWGLHLSVLCPQCWLDPTKEIKKQICSKFQIIHGSLKCDFQPENEILKINAELMR